MSAQTTEPPVVPEACSNCQRIRDRYQAVIDALEQGVALLEAVEGGEDFVIVDVNPMGASIARAHRDSLVGRRITHLGEDVSTARFLERLREAYRTGEPQHLDSTRMEHPEIPAWISARVTPLPSGELLAVLSDITEIEENRLRLIRLDERFRRTAEDSPDAILVLDMSHRVVYANGAAEQLFQRTCEDLAGESLGHLLASGPEGEVEVRRPDGSVRVGEVRSGPTMWDGADATLVTIRDVTQLKEARYRLAASEQKLKSIFDHVHFGIALLDHEYRVQEVNRQMTEWFGSRDQIVGKVCVDIFSGCKEKMGCDACPVKATFKTGTVHETVMVRTIGGTETTFRVLASPVLDEQGEIVSVIEMLEDITETRALEAQLQQAQKMEAIGRLAGGVAHDFNNLLTIIRGHAEFIEGALEPGAPILEDLRRIQEASERAASLTHQLLAFSRRQPMRPRVLSLNTVLEEMGRMMRRVIGEDVRVVFDLDPVLWSVEADRARIEQMVMNLVVNAREAMPGGGTLTLKTANVVVKEREARQRPPMTAGRYVLLSVADTGCGMDEKTQVRVFEPFFTTKKETGTGLGLSTVYGIVKQSHGFIWVESEVGRGTVFEVYLPAVDRESDDETKPARSRRYAGHGETILVAEDDDLVRRLARRILERAGYRVLEASSGHEALFVARTHPGTIHLLMTDLVMPGMGGRVLARELSAIRPDMAILFTSGYTENMVMREGPLGEGVRLLEKPFDRNSLLGAVEEALTRGA